MHSKTDPVKLSADLIRCKSVTPSEGGAIDLLTSLLASEGFNCYRIDRNGISNLFAVWGEGKNGKTLGFNGHTDVVPVGNISLWSSDPFGGEIKDGKIWGRGACDMKSGVAAFSAAAIDYIKETPPDGSVVIAITGDEEGDATDGTIAILDWMKTKEYKLDACLVGEPTSVEHIGDTVKIGRRGSMTVHLTVAGKQGHAAYPHRANNPIPALAKLVNKLSAHKLDKGSKHFDPSNLSVTTIDTGNTASNVIPANVSASINIRFNDLHSSNSLKDWLLNETKLIENEFNLSISLKFKVSGESFLTPPGDLSYIVQNAVLKETGILPNLSTSGGTSDARFIKDHCPVVEIGLVGKSMHQTDEHVELKDIIKLKSIYSRILKNYFSRSN
jgi:succinyl-diaminopimelate desuccinylase